FQTTRYLVADRNLEDSDHSDSEEFEGVYSKVSTRHLISDPNLEDSDHSDSEEFEGAKLDQLSNEEKERVETIEDSDVPSKLLIPKVRRSAAYKRGLETAAIR
ncbi:hypothetical protein PFISCL1PPCAC_28170, partial [Pristionchus fissidentatus]